MGYRAPVQEHTGDQVRADCHRSYSGRLIGFGCFLVKGFTHGEKDLGIGIVVGLVWFGVDGFFGPFEVEDTYWESYETVKIRRPSVLIELGNEH